MSTNVTGLASGFDWSTMVDQLTEINRAPERVLQNDQSNIQALNSAYASLKTQLTTLKSKVDALKDPALYTGRLVTSSDTTTATAKVSDGAVAGNYTFQVTQLATAAALQGTGNVGKALDSTKTLNSAGFNTTITAGTFAINGKQITVEDTDTLDSLISKINSTADIGVNIAYSPTGATDKLQITSTNGQEVILGSATDSSNFLQAARLTTLSADKMTVTSSAELGSLNLTSTLGSANFATPVTNGSSGATSFKINGVEITYDATTDTLGSILNKISGSTAGVLASYDSVNDRVLLTNKNTGDTGFVLEEASDGSQGNFLQATGLMGGTIARGSNLKYTINGGGELISQSNTITEASSGIAGLSVTAIKENTPVTVTVTANTDKVKTAITDFIAEYNKSQGLIDTQSAITTDSSGKVTAGIMSNESEVASIATQLRSLSFTSLTVAGTNISALSGLGIDTGGYDNNLTLDTSSTALDDALQNNLTSLQNFFTDSTDGWATKMSAFLDKLSGDDGTITTKQTLLTQQSTDLDTQIATIERTVLETKQQLTDSFVAMETARNKINQQLSYLQQNLGLTSSSSG